MGRQSVAEPARPVQNRGLYLLGYVVFGVVAVREVTFRAGTPSLPVAAVLLGAILLLLATDPFLFRRLSWYRYFYFVSQTCLVLALGLLHPYMDFWGVLFITLSVRAYHYLPRTAAMAWGLLAAGLMILILMFTVGWLNGLGVGLTLVAGAVLVVSWESVSGEAERARRQSYALLVDLQQAHQKLKEYAAQVGEEAAAQERDRLAHELHDSVGQAIFAISLTAESARTLLVTDPSRVPDLLERLQNLTSGALGQMRALITQWRPK